MINAIPTEESPRNCPNTDFHQQPNSYHQERIGKLGSVMDLDIVNAILNPMAKSSVSLNFSMLDLGKVVQVGNMNC